MTQLAQGLGFDLADALTRDAEVLADFRERARTAVVEAEAQAQAICMQTQDFTRAYNAFVAKQKPVFEGN